MHPPKPLVAKALVSRAKAENTLPYAKLICNDQNRLELARICLAKCGQCFVWYPDKSRHDFIVQTVRDYGYNETEL